MARAARVSGLLDKDFDDSWIVPARPRRARGNDIAPEPVVAPEPIVAPEPVFVPDSVVSPHPEPRRANQLSRDSTRAVLGRNVQSFDVSCSLAHQPGNVIANRQFHNSLQHSGFIFRDEHLTRLVKAAREEFSDLQRMFFGAVRPEIASHRCQDGSVGWANFANNHAEHHRGGSGNSVGSLAGSVAIASSCG